ncbi:MAG TPA: hypothetical protein VLH35_01260 [Candidatus Acidoferrales bacterium]|nr:hypothetical protein [Candidatus Acidoferrales bacterium]
MSKGRGISADIQLPRTKLLYLIYSAPHSRVKAAPGVKSQICSALGYKSDGHFHHDWNYLLDATMLEEKDGYFAVTENGKKEFSLQSNASRSNQIMVGLGIVLIVFTLLLELGVVPMEGAAVFGVALIFLGGFFSILGRANKPELPISARVLLKELKKLG